MAPGRNGTRSAASRLLEKLRQSSHCARPPMAKKLPAGQRAVGWFKLRSTPEGSLHREFELCNPIGEDPRAVAMECHFSWDRPDDQPASYGISFRGARISVRVADLYDEVVHSVTRYVEGLDTSTKRQRFRVMRAPRGRNPIVRVEGARCQCEKGDSREA